MPAKIRLMRIGAKKRPFYRVVVVDERKKRTGAYIEALGTYNPLTEPKEVILKKERVAWWLKQGAVPSYGYLRIVNEAPQRAPRKPKKSQEEKPAPEQKPAGEPAPAEEIPAEEAPTETETPPAEAEEQTPAEQAEEKAE